MKKIAAISLLIFYLIPASGFCFTSHFCGGELASISLYGFDNSCACGKDMLNSNCCQNIITHAEFSDSQDKTPTVELDLLNVTKVLGVLHLLHFCFAYLLPEPVVTINPHPPDIQPDNPLYLQHRVFRI